MKANDKPCHECPFVKTSLSSWLGPYTGEPEKFVQDTFHEDSMVCHLTARKDRQHHRLCAGGLICASKSSKRFRLPGLYEEQDRLRATSEEVWDSVMNRNEFVEHHRKAPAIIRVGLKVDEIADRVDEKVSELSGHLNRVQYLELCEEIVGRWNLAADTVTEELNEKGAGDDEE